MISTGYFIKVLNKQMIQKEMGLECNLQSSVALDLLPSIVNAPREDSTKCVENEVVMLDDVPVSCRFTT